jgi:hypothetical protein
VSPETITPELLEEKRQLHGERRTFGPDDLAKLLELLDLADVVVSVREAIEMTDRPDRLIALRHDIDHDLDNAVLFARLEAERGYRASYYFLHSDWYYRDGTDGPLSEYVLDAAREIAGLGHEIALHNNVIAEALRTGREPHELISTELEHLRAAGFDVVGTVAHGDELCHRVGFVNAEVFVECPRPKLGAPDRTLTWVEEESGTERSVALAPVPMASLGLSYEANYIGHRFYLSDSGGSWHRPIEDAMAEMRDIGGFLQILSHPIWWAFGSETFTLKEPKSQEPGVYGIESKLRRLGE